eukprot:2276277-Rhodomonas_salina.2
MLLIRSDSEPAFRRMTHMPTKPSLGPDCAEISDVHQSPLTHRVCHSLPPSLPTVGASLKFSPCFHPPPYPNPYPYPDPKSSPPGKHSITAASLACSYLRVSSVWTF